MNKLVFQQGGHEFNLDNLEFLQSSQLEVLSHLVKSDLPTSVTKCVLWGVKVAKNGDDYTHTSGAIYFNGEIFTVDELSTAITDTGTPKFAVAISPELPTIYKSGDVHKVHHVRKMKMVSSGDASAEFPYNSIAPKSALLHTLTAYVGTIKQVKMSNVSNHFDLATGLGLSDWWKGWKIDDDSKGRVIVGYSNNDNDYNSANGSKKGGLKEVVLTEGQLPLHKHGAGTLDANENGDHTHSLFFSKGTNEGSSGGFASSGTDGSHAANASMGGNGAHTHSLSGETGAIGDDLPHENRQPYVAYLIVERIAD